MIPFLGIGADQLVESAVGYPGTANKDKLRGDDGTM